ncbi:GNAT family N-acetyltransferase [Nakamurella aerolata]|uniref:GNAT family N-acetyltransferase n=1 Tax=Nakamurella aerolata TaxID=1656892 RepID=A0A849A448_9ACTN|nr:GNAT family N-acetyltransferase [Nakamurella aerolata]NNG34436.1 GNAT family N-acetyltransferase [Nakamurella aerolata]
MRAYYRALPFANGLPNWEPANAAWHGGSEPWPPPNSPAADTQLDEWAAADIEDSAFHPMAAFVDGQCVGASATISFDVTVPGGRTMPMAGVTATGVIATHRRRGHLRRMMQAMFVSALERSEPLAMLSASEGSIYGRFGFSVATYRSRLEIGRHEAEFLPAPADTGSLELVDATVARSVWPEVHRPVRANRVGELRPLASHWSSLSDSAAGTSGPLRFLIHRSAEGVADGIANFRLPWSATERDAGTLIIEALEATDSQAYRALWQLLLDFDLTRTVVAPGRPRQEPLTWMLTNPRAVRVTRQSDNLWARLLDVPTALAGRAYANEESITLRIPDDPMCPQNVGTWELKTRGQRPTCVPVDRVPDAVLSIQAISSLFFGGVSAHDLAYAGQIKANSLDAVDRISRLFSIDPLPHNSFGF